MGAELKERRELYRDVDVQRFLVEFAVKGGEIEPTFDLTHGYRYADVEKTTQKDPKATKAFLERLAKVGVLDRKLHDMEIRCPSNDSPNVSTQYACPHCNSIRILRNALIEHITCGYIDNLTKFKTDNELICPNCKQRLTEGGYRSAGSWYECADCGKRVEVLKVVHICRDDKDRFTFDDAIYNEVYAYSLNAMAIDEVEREVLYAYRLRELFQNLGYRVQSPGTIRGDSGIDHEFDLVATAEGKGTVTVDTLLSDSPIPQIRIITEYAKVFDAKAKAYIVAVPGLEESAAKLAQFYKMNVITVSRLSGALSLIEAALRASGEEVSAKVERTEVVEEKEVGGKEKPAGLITGLVGLFKRRERKGTEG